MAASPPQTVLGAPVADDYDLVLAHEHLKIDIRCWFDAESPQTGQLRDVRVTPESAVRVQEHPFACLDNLVLDDLEAIVAELEPLGTVARPLIVDVTPENVGRDVRYLRHVAERTGLDIVFGCGLYTADSRRGEPSRSVDDYRRDIVSQFRGPGPHPAVIGEIGTGNPITADERDSLIGATLAQAELGVPLYVHLHPWARRGHEVLDIVEEHGGDLSATVLCHLDVQIPSGLDYHRALLARGCMIAFDIWGDEFPYGGHGMPTDAERLDATRELIAAGHGSQLVHSHDVCTKTQLRANGGPGFVHVPTTTRAAMRRSGLEPDEVHRQLAGNALDLLHRRPKENRGR